MRDATRDAIRGAIRFESLNLVFFTSSGDGFDEGCHEGCDEGCD